MLLQIHYRIHQRAHLEPVRSLDAALRDIAVLNVESPGRSGGQHVARIPALDRGMQGDQAGRAVGHVGDHVLRVNFAVVHALDFQFQHVRDLIGGHELRAEGEEGREVLHDAEVTGVALQELEEDGLPVNNDYKSPFTFTGKIFKGTVDIKQ